MKRIPSTPRANWRQILNEQGFHFHSIDEHGEDRSGDTDKFLYWREDVAYEFTESQVETLYEASRELHAMSLDLVDDLVRRGDLGQLQVLSLGAQALVEQSWRRRDPHLYGRFDLSWDGHGEPKLLEYNADTPTSIIETAVAQWGWKEDARPEADQFNSLHEALVERLGEIRRDSGRTHLHLACLFDSQEDTGNAEYMLDVALQAGWQASMVDMAEIGVGPGQRYMDGQDRPIEACFKLYPWEWMVAEPLGQHLALNHTLWLEPLWKMALSNKAMLALLWERHPDHPNLLPTYFAADHFGTLPFVKKPLLSREGANISFMNQGSDSLQTEGPYGQEGFVFQAYAPVARFAAPEATSIHGPLEAIHAALGCWMVGDEAVGLCVREDPSPVTKNTAYFVPHCFI